MVLQLPIQSKGPTEDSSAVASSLLLQKDVVSATPTTSNLASGIYQIGSHASGAQRPNLSSNVSLNLQKQQLPQQQVAANNLQYPLQMQSSLSQQFLLPQTMQLNPQMLPNNNVASVQSVGSFASPSLYSINANLMTTQFNQQRFNHQQQAVSTSAANTAINSNNMMPWMKVGVGTPNPLAKVTVGGRSLFANNSGDGSNISSINNNVTNVMGSRSRVEGASPRPPISNSNAKLQHSTSSAKGLSSTLQSTPSKVVNFEELAASVVEDRDKNVYDCQETALTTELLTLSVHEALAFDGVELALHPDLFKDNKRSKDHNVRIVGLQPGDLVEIRVWSARSDITTSNSKPSAAKKSTLPIGGNSSLHSRNTSLASVTSSSIFSSVSVDNSLPSAKMSEQTMGQNEVNKDPKKASLNTKDKTSPAQSTNPASRGILGGERSQEPSPMKRVTSLTASSTTTLLAGAASSLLTNSTLTPNTQSPPPPMVPVGAALKGSLVDESTMASHSRESSMLTNSTVAGVHSRESSIFGGLHSRDSSLMNPLSINSSPTKESPSSSPHPGTLALEAVEKKQSHSIISNISGISSQNESIQGQFLPIRRDGHPLVTTKTTLPQLQNLIAAEEHSEITPAASPQTPLSTTPLSISKPTTTKSPSQRQVPSPVEQSKDSVMNNKQGRLSMESVTSVHGRNDSISSTVSSAAASNSHRSNPMPSTLAPMLPPTHRGSSRSSLHTDILDKDNKIDGDLLDPLRETHFVRTSFVMPVSDQSLKSIKSSARTKVSLLRRVADLYQITGFDTVTVTQIPPRDAPYVHQQISADFVTITFKDQFVSRGDMYYFQRSFLNSWVYEGKRLSFNGIRTNTKVIRHGDHPIRSGIISEDTKLTFRSKSARIIWLVQLSSEMWDFASPYKAVGNQKNKEPSCETYFNKFITFARKLFEKWKRLELTHNLTVVFFSRTFVRHKDEAALPSSTQAVRSNSDGRMYCDNYKIVLNNETKADWSSLIHRMKQSFVNYPREVKWDLTPGLERTPSSASQGNILEAVNMTLNLLHLHFIDRDLHRTGNSIVILTAGNGVFEVEKNLAGITKQRMMDNGIGSDCLSLGLPPLHVIPFFLFRNESKENTAEEMQGFDNDGGATSSFEVPHWMNLSYVDYDDEEEEMLFKEHIKDDESNDEKHKNDVIDVPIISNGFLRRNKPVQNVESAPSSFPALDTKTTAKDHAKHLISQRGFEDILQACRPRLRGDYGTGLPISLTKLLLRKSSPGDNHSIQFSEQMKVVDHLDRFSPQRSFRDRNLEWGAVNFDDFNMSSISSSFKRSQLYKMSTSLSESSSASSFASIGSSMLLPQPTGGINLQSTTSLNLESGRVTPTLHHDDSSTTLDIDGENPQEDHGNSISMIEKMMREHDEHTFSGRNGRVSPTNSTFAGSFNSGNAGSPKLEGSSPLARSQSAMLPSLLNKGGGIEAALAQYDKTPDLTFSKPSAAAPATSEKRLSTSPVISSIPLTFSLDRRNEAYNTNFKRLGQERINAITEGLQSLDIHRRSNKGLAGDRRNSFAQGSSKQQLPDVSLSKTSMNPSTNRNKSKKNSNQHRYRRKVFVLNPFRQEDEDEVLAKRTHNRRRWSHVFPLGEAEFKKHAGPNWKSLCQPAILPMTIDFHPDPVELQDRDKFRIKQYSVTLPPMNESNYKDATELLDDLMVQRIRQDFQLVPRSILNAHRDTDNTNHAFSRTLSMGHKIQKLSYNPSSDSVDVVQYYANFAENESPQSYRYLLWSALRQDYVSVVQTFTKYTSPYRWNELDMLISGDTISSISEDMRHPRISFVILPDSFTNQTEESEYSGKFQRLVEYFKKLQKTGTSIVEIETFLSDDRAPRASKRKKSFIVDLRRRSSDKYEWLEIVHDSNCDTRRTFRITIQYLVAVGSKIDQQAQLLHRRCAQYGLNLIRVPNYSSLRLCFLNPFSVPITIPVRDKTYVDRLEEALTSNFDFVYDDSHMADPNELVDFLDGFDFVVNRWSMNKRKKFVPAKQFLHRRGILFVRLLRDAQGKAIVIIYLNNIHIAGDVSLLNQARTVFNEIEHFINEMSSKEVDDNV